MCPCTHMFALAYLTVGIHTLRHKKYTSLSVTLEYKIEYACFNIVIYAVLFETTQNRFSSAHSHTYVCIDTYVCIYVQYAAKCIVIHSHSRPAVLTKRSLSFSDSLLLVASSPSEKYNST